MKLYGEIFNNNQVTTLKLVNAVMPVKEAFKQSPNLGAFVKQGGAGGMLTGRVVCPIQPLGVCPLTLPQCR